ncbi:MAG: hypothetical protein WC542_10300 [Paludibacter sp.]
MTRFYCLILYFFLTSASIFSTEFVSKAYIIDKDSVKTEGFIRFFKYKTTPVSIYFCKDEFGKYELFKPDDIIEFKFKNQHFISADVQVELSPTNTSTLNDNPEFIFEKKRIFLEIIIDGNKSLYQYKSPFKKDLFYIMQNGKLTLLQQKYYKKYADDKYFKVENKRYIGQLMYYLNDSAALSTNPGMLNYNLSSLRNLFQNYYLSKDTHPVYSSIPRNTKITWGLIGGIVNNAFNETHTEFLVDEYKGRLAPVFGVFAEFLFKNSLWSLHYELLYAGKVTNYTYNKEYHNPEYYTENTLNSSYRAITGNLYAHFPFRLRNGEMFLNVGLYNTSCYDLKTESIEHYKFYSTETTKNLYHLDYHLDAGYLLGAGWCKNNYSIELRYIPGIYYHNFISPKQLNKISILFSYNFSK